MSYKIQYSPETHYFYPNNQNRHNVRWGRWMFLAILFASVLWLRLNGIPDLLIPGDPQVTKTATVHMVDQLRTGVTFDQALTVFCKEIIDGAKA